MFGSKKTNNKKQEFDTPDWFKQFEDKFGNSVSNAFLFTGNITDYAVPGELFQDYLVSELKKIKYGDSDGFDRIISYDAYKKGQILFNKNENDSLINPLWGTILEGLKSTKTKTALIITSPSFLFGNGGQFSFEDEKNHLLSFIQLMQDKRFITSDNLVILVSETKSGLPSMLFSSSSKLTPLVVPYPNLKERLEYIEYLDIPCKKEISNEVFANLTAGLSRFNIEDISLVAIANKELQIDMILERKNELISKEYGDVIEVYDTRKHTLENYAGQEHVKNLLKYDVINPIQTGDKMSVPKGLLFVGPPGTGKTYMSLCMAGSMGINFIEFKMSKILNKYVGESEQNLEKAFNCFEAMAPVGVFIDEADQAISRGDNHSNNVASNMFGMFLSFMSNEAHRGNIIFIGATNYPNNMDEALKRTGRFDIKIPFFPPMKNERMNVLKIHLNKRKVKYILTSEDEDIIASLTEGYTQAEIENLVIKSIKICKWHTLDTINLGVIERAIESLVVASNEKIDEMCEIALNEVNDYDYLNDFYKSVKRKMVKGISYAKAITEIKMEE